MRNQVEKFLWIGIIIIIGLVGYFIYINFSNSSKDAELLNIQKNACNNLFLKIKYVCYSGNGTSIYFDFYVTKYFNGLYVNDTKIICSYYNANLSYTSECKLQLNTSIEIKYYTEGLYYTRYHNYPYEIFNLIIRKVSPTDIVIELEKAT